MADKTLEIGTPTNNHSVTVKLAGGRTFLLSLEHLLSLAMCLQEKRSLLRTSAADFPETT